MTQYPSQGSRSSKAEDAIVNSGVVSVLVAAMLAAFYLVTSIYIGSHRLFWYHEIVTVHIAGLPNLATILDALAHGADGMPPGYYTLATAVQRLIGASEVAARLTSALAMAAGLLITFDCARRLTDGLHRLVGLAVLSCSFLPYYGYEARSYAIYFMLPAISFWIWTCTPQRQEMARDCIRNGAFLVCRNSLLRCSAPGSLRTMGTVSLETMTPSFVKADCRALGSSFGCRSHGESDALLFATVFGCLFGDTLDTLLQRIEGAVL